MRIHEHQQNRVHVYFLSPEYLRLVPPICQHLPLCASIKGTVEAKLPEFAGGVIEIEGGAVRNALWWESQCWLALFTTSDDS